jgi:hypothetical protein
MMLEIAQHDFVVWKKDPVTLSVFKYLQSVADYTLEMMTGQDLISSPNGHLKLNEMRGYVNALEEIINMQSITIEETSDEISQSSGV